MRRGLVLTALLVIAAGCAASRPLADASLTPILRPHDAIYRPPGEGPFPAVLVLHGCLGVRSKDTRWAESLRDDGYVALVVDSMTGRGLTTLDQRRNVCTGWTLWGGTRAADVLASLAYLRTLPFVDGARLCVIGFSHGAWAALDLLASASWEDVAGLRAVIGFYPYCGVASRSRWLGVQLDVPTLLLLAGSDQFVSAEQCRGVAERATAARRRALRDWRASAATDDAHRRVRAFLAEHLAGGAVRQAGARP